MIKVSLYVFLSASEGVCDGLVQSAWRCVVSLFMNTSWTVRQCMDFEHYGKGWLILAWRALIPREKATKDL